MAERFDLVILGSGDRRQRRLELAGEEGCVAPQERRLDLRSPSHFCHAPKPLTFDLPAHLAFRVMVVHLSFRELGNKKAP